MIINAQTKLDIDQEFKVEAGPGAGKTEFLVNHIKNVIQESEKLDRTRKIACITYTNTAVETILERLGKSASNRADVSTIHSFLYKNVVKPYCYFLPKEYEVNIQKLKGHNDPIVINAYMREWLESANFNELKHPNSKKQLLKQPEQNKALKNWLQSMKVVFCNNDVIFHCDDKKALSTNKTTGKYVRIRKSNLNILQEKLLDYKKIYWKNGYIDHEDILFFSYILIKNYPFLLTVLRAKYPYFFVDEFQDTSPVQAFIIDEIKKKKCVVGVIGDKAQSIYGFQGAQVSLFEDFKVDQTNFHVISENRRSAYQIVTFLNEIRKDIKQRQYHKKENSPVSILIGERNKAFFKANNDCNGELTSLSRDNITSNAMKRDIEENRLDKKLLDKFRETDGNNRRKNFILGLIQAVELAVNTKYKEAIKEIEYLYKGNEDSKKQALYILSNLINQYNQFEQGTLMEFYNILDGVLDESLPGFKKGKPKDFYENTMYHDLAICAVNIVEDVSKHITIHKAKGSEFENVLVIGNKDALNLLKQPDLENNEEQRIFYVAMSRAKERLFVQFDNLRDEDEKVIKKFYDIDIIRLN